MEPAGLPESANLVLVGYRGCGKSVLGARVAAALGRPLFDLDREIEVAHGRSVREIFETDGEAWFRDVEEEMLEGVLAREGIVLAPGGGVVLREANRDRLRRQQTVFLDVPASALVARLAWTRDGEQEKRPALTDLPFEQEVMSTLAARRRFYLDVAVRRLQVPAGESPEESCARLLAMLDEPPEPPEPPSGASRPEAPGDAD